MKKFSSKGQDIKLSGVGGHHQNDVAENGIMIVVYKSHTMMIHTAIRWSEVSEKDM